jgi:vacuolar-type H+-ATPase subunit F/Vma7
MARSIFIGDEVTAAGFRLAGLEVRVPAPEETAAALQAAQAANPPLILLTAEYAAYLDPATLEEALTALGPALHLVTDAGGRVAVPDLAATVRARVGVSQ